LHNFNDANLCLYEIAGQARNDVGEAHTYWYVTKPSQNRAEMLTPSAQHDNGGDLPLV
jgi:hypothetical protein